MRKCAVCGREFEAYLPIEKQYRTGESRPELLNKEEYSCPFCYSSDRDRMIILFFKKLRSKMNQGIDILEIAPSGALQKYLFSNWGRSNLYTADLFMEGVDYQADIQNMQEVKDNAFDAIVCSHVLEHVQNDKMAMRELHRILDKKGLGIIIVPLDLSQAFTDEEWGLSEEENLRRFGQEDHVRKYNKEEFISRLQESGFHVHAIGKDFFSEQEFAENALTDTSTLYLVYKSKLLYKNLDHAAENFAKSHSNKMASRQFIKSTDHCHCWIDVCEVKDGNLSVWGWIYIYNCDSRQTKLKLMLKSDTEEIVFGMVIRKRDDIQEKFGDMRHNYAFSGVDFQMPQNCVPYGTYTVSILLQNGNKKYERQIKNELMLGK